MLKVTFVMNAYQYYILFKKIFSIKKYIFIIFIELSRKKKELFGK